MRVNEAVMVKQDTRSGQTSIMSSSVFHAKRQLRFPRTLIQTLVSVTPELVITLQISQEWF